MADQLEQQLLALRQADPGSARIPALGGAVLDTVAVHANTGEIKFIRLGNALGEVFAAARPAVSPAHLDLGERAVILQSELLHAAGSHMRPLERIEEAQLVAKRVGDLKTISRGAGLRVFEEAAHLRMGDTPFGHARATTLEKKGLEYLDRAFGLNGLLGPVEDIVSRTIVDPASKLPLDTRMNAAQRMMETIFTAVSVDSQPTPWNSVLMTTALFLLENSRDPAEHRVKRDWAERLKIFAPVEGAAWERLDAVSASKTSLNEAPIGMNRLLRSVGATRQPDAPQPAQVSRPKILPFTVSKTGNRRIARTPLGPGSTGG